MPSRKETEDRIIKILREHFLKYSDEVVEKYKNQIQAAVKWYVKGLPRHIATSESDDLTSEARIAFVDALKTWDPRKGDLWPYVSFRLKGAMQDYLRKRGTDPVAGLYEWITSAANVYMAFNKQIIYHDKIDQMLHVDYAMKVLDEKERKVIKGYYKHDKTFKQIGKDIGLSESQVSRICKEATAKMKHALTRHQNVATAEEPS
ncbi:MAG: sigma-70 family RNA polymerase sigma factor [Candidatus Margulisbacteria bacterium]|nr:sigma-70 family RNA polymerase sigma factor [Candidatus Margulisiibacteriota bacterium]MBU1021198.1 sigma-70 family RNA polymerase sigma factor [Candidatus Margulisiibacteriota bacterium]MBU1729804.1 sigma-70 family RNA polymerase sigma factor [Candidatus Margulisiibacteriota bacterium]MBU1955305.1 sigma-70 family RNA polymerase sigma factor [Candidatus Margulisiibacteriota bacterium]